MHMNIFLRVLDFFYFVLFFSNLFFLKKYGALGMREGRVSGGAGVRDRCGQSPAIRPSRFSVIHQPFDV